MVKDERVYLGHIREAIHEYASVGREAFMAERMRQDAKLSNATKDRRSEIPWKQIAGMRDPTHDYFGVDLVLVWRVIERDLPVLNAAGSGRL